MLNNFAATQGGGTGTVTTTTILDGTIANADVASDAAIAISKIDLGNTLEIETSSGDQIFEMDNNASNSSNFQIQNGAGNARTDFYLDGSSIITLKNQMVGIGDTSPSYALDVNTTGRFTTDLIVGGKIGIGTTSPNTDLTVDGTVTLKEQAAADGDTAAYGQIWVKSDTPNTLYFTNDAGTDVQLGAGSGDASGPGSATDNAIARFDGTGGKTLQNSSTTIDDNGDIVVGGTTPTITIGDGGTEDAALIFDGNALDFHVGLDDTADDLVIGVGTALGTTPAISINSDRDVTISDGAIDFDVASHDTSNGLKLGGTLVTATAAELNIMDGVTATAAEINLIDGGTSRGTTAVASGDGILINDGGTMAMTNVDTVSTYFASHSVGGGNIVTTGALNSGSITSGFGTIDTGSSAITTTGLISGGSLDIDNVLINGTTIGHTDDTDLITVANGLVTVAGEISVTTLDIGGTNVSSTAAELNILDGVTSTATELNYNDITTLGTVQTSKTVTADSSGIVNHADYQVVRPYFKDYAETINAMGDVGGGTDAIDLSAGNVVTATVSTGAQTFTFTNPSADGRACSFTLFLTNGGSQTVNWPGAVDWAGGSAPSLTSSGVDVLTFTTLDAGTIWYGFAAGLDMG